MTGGPLAGIRILEVGTMLAGPYATMMLADLGAEVIKIEPPGGEISRQVSDSYFASLNRNKRSICLELNPTAGQRRLGELVAEPHALLVNIKPSVIRRLGLTYEALRRYNERIVCVALTGFGLDGGDEPAFDYVVQAATGVAAHDRRSGRAADAAGVLLGRQLHGIDRGAGAAGADRLGPRRPGGRVLRDVMLSQLNYRASAYLNDGVEPAAPPVRRALVSTFRRSCFRLPTAIWRCSSPMTASGNCSRRRRVSRVSRRWPSGRRVATRCSPW